MDVSHPGSQKTWLATGSLFTMMEDAVSVVEIALTLHLWLSPTYVSASNEERTDLQLASYPLVFTQSFVL